MKQQQQHTEFLAHRYVFSEEEVLGEVAPEGLEAAGLVQQLLPHEGGHARGAVHPHHRGREVDTGVECPEVDLGWTIRYLECLELELEQDKAWHIGLFT